MWGPTAHWFWPNRKWTEEGKRPKEAGGPITLLYQVYRFLVENISPGLQCGREIHDGSHSPARSILLERVEWSLSWGI